MRASSASTSTSTRPGVEGGAAHATVELDVLVDAELAAVSSMYRLIAGPSASAIRRSTAELEAESEQVRSERMPDIGTDPTYHPFPAGPRGLCRSCRAQRLQPVSGVDPGRCRADHDDIEIGAHEVQCGIPAPWWALNHTRTVPAGAVLVDTTQQGVNGFDNGCLTREGAEDDGYLGRTIRQKTQADTKRTDFALASPKRA